MSKAMKGLMAPAIEIALCPSIVNTEENKANTELAIKEWRLGPLKPSDEPTANKPYWQDLANVWKITEGEARRQRCANCEYFENTPEMIMMMEEIPRNAFDADAGGRGYCHKLDLICHNLRACQAWERKEYEAD